jgi:hypothetical protein
MLRARGREGSTCLGLEVGMLDAKGSTCLGLGVGMLDAKGSTCLGLVCTCTYMEARLAQS